MKAIHFFIFKGESKRGADSSPTLHLHSWRFQGAKENSKRRKAFHFSLSLTNGTPRARYSLFILFKRLRSLLMHLSQLSRYSRKFIFFTINEKWFACFCISRHFCVMYMKMPLIQKSIYHIYKKALVLMAKNDFRPSHRFSKSTKETISLSLDTHFLGPSI